MLLSIKTQRFPLTIMFINDTIQFSISLFLIVIGLFGLIYSLIRYFCQIEIQIEENQHEEL